MAKKGTTGKNTGAKTRTAIKKAIAKGATLKKIGNATGRDDSTIGSILGGRIKNPPAGLAKSISKVKGSKTATKKKAKGSKITNHFPSPALRGPANCGD